MSVAHALETGQRLAALELRRDGVAVVSLDAVLEAHHVLSPAFGAQLSAVIDSIEQDASIAAAVFVIGRGERALVHADLGTLAAIRFAADAERLALEAASVLARIERLRKPAVAAVHGAALGGPFELALACHALVASDDPATRFGLPQSRLGLIPAANGLLRLAHRSGLRAAAELALSGRALRADAALRLRLVDEVCPRPILLEAAVRRAKGLLGRLPRVQDEHVDLAALVLERNAIGRALFFRSARERERTRLSPHYHLAPERILDVLERQASRGFDAAAQLEAKAFGELVVSETAHRLLELFSATAALGRETGVDDRAPARRVAHVAVLGGGEVGTGVACATAAAGMAVRIHERDDAAAGRALRAVHERIEQATVRGSRGADEREGVLARLSACADLSGLKHADVVVDALPEDLASKQALLRQVEARIAPSCVYASHAATIPVARLAAAAVVPGRLVGMRYAAPVRGMKLLEVVRTDRTESWAVATAVSLGKRQGRTVIVVKDSPGFYAPRVLAPLIHEAVHLFHEGVPIESIDGALLQWGFVAGPLEILDEVGVEVAARLGQLLQAAFGERFTPPGGIARLLAAEHTGRKGGRGIYRRDASAGRPGRGWTVDPAVPTLLGVRPGLRLPVEEIQMRCALALVNEAVRCLGEGVLRGPSDGDVGAVFGLGFPACRGGPFRYVDTLGPAEMLRRVQAYADRFGERWRPAPLLVQMARRGESFYAR